MLVVPCGMLGKSMAPARPLHRMAFALVSLEMLRTTSANIRSQALYPFDPDVEQSMFVGLNDGAQRLRVNIKGVNLSATYVDCDADMEDSTLCVSGAEISDEDDLLRLRQAFFPNAATIPDRELYEAKRAAFRRGTQTECGKEAAGARQMRHYLADGHLALDLVHDLVYIGAIERSEANRDDPREVRILNIGGGDTIHDDPLSQLQTQNYVKGLLVEADDERFEALRQYATPNLKIENFLVDPGKISFVEDRLRNAFDLSPGDGGKVRVDILKVDIDSIDCLVVEALAPRLDIKAIIIETNKWIPPPFQFTLLFPSEKVPNQMNGCSVSYAVNRFLRHGFRLVFYSGEDAVFVHDDVLKAGTRVNRNPMVSPLREYSSPLDEFECYRSIEQFGLRRLDGERVAQYLRGWPIPFVREWFFTLPIEEAATALWGNLTAIHADVPFMLWHLLD
eukprot:TRINITY_DN122728_c0_g1_i1.p1 TRINITY_DN122728_c0_g1~~TRINITY_DN122728_c0_g1_i1.p1  ORF type:complete len:450 (+),score=70.88 TRINITY_DN122728_c0_g1_i1:79-1428(+)